MTGCHPEISAGCKGRWSSPILILRLDKRPLFRYIIANLAHQGRQSGDAGRWGRSGSRGQGLVTSAPGRLTGKRPAGMMTGLRLCRWTGIGRFQVTPEGCRVPGSAFWS
jgi:hypothetical protein